MNVKMNSNNLFIFIVITIYIALNIYLGINYSPWRDVAQAWLLSRDLSYAELFHQMHYEGHPMLWHLILSIFSKNGFPYDFIFLISTSFVTIAAFLFLKFAPFEKIVKVIILSSAVFIFYLPVVARSYALFPVLIFCLAILWKNRNKYIIEISIILALMLQTHIYFCGFVGGIFLVLLYEIVKDKHLNNNNLLGIAIVLSSLFLLYIQIAPDGTETAGQYEKTILEKLTIYISMPKLYIKILIGKILSIFGFGIFQFDYFFDSSDFIICVPLIIIFIIILIKENSKIAFVFICTYIWLIYISMFHYHVGSGQKIYSVFHFLIFFWWIMSIENKEYLINKILLIYVLLFSVFTWGFTLEIFTKDLKPYYSNSKETALFIKDNIPNNATIIIDNETFDSSVAAYFPQSKFYNPLRNNSNSFATWDHLKDAKFCNGGDFDDLIKNSDILYKNRENLFYLIDNKNEGSTLKMFDKSSFKIKDQWEFADDLIYEENFILYELESH